MNLALLGKWWWKFKDPTFSSKWKTLIQHLYYNPNRVMTYSSFWSEIVQLEQIGQCSLKYTPGECSLVRFWEDLWYGDCSLSAAFSHLYKICTNPNVLLSDVIHSQGACVQFRRSFTRVDQCEWGHLLHIISTISFTHSHDKVAWRWEKSGNFSVRSLYKILNFGGIGTNQPMTWWHTPIPRKIQIFMWLTCRKRILTKDQLCKRGWKGDTKCQFCHEQETADHLFLKCRFTQQVWFWMGQSQLRFKTWNTIQDILEFAYTLTKYSRQAFLLVFSGFCWTIWKHRNEICFQQIPVKSGRQLILLIISLVEYWTGSKRVKKKVRTAIWAWLPPAEALDTIPLRIWMPGDDQLRSDNTTDNISNSPSPSA